MIEREKLGKGNSRDAKAAALGLEILKKRAGDGKITILPSEKESADDVLLELGKSGYAVVTQDRELQERLKKEGCKIIRIRQKKYPES
jgi:rRNA-processing protein FCF1